MPSPSASSVRSLRIGMMKIWSWKFQGGIRGSHLDDQIAGARIQNRTRCLARSPAGCRKSPDCLMARRKARSPCRCGCLPDPDRPCSKSPRPSPEDCFPAMSPPRRLAADARSMDVGADPFVGTGRNKFEHHPPESGRRTGSELIVLDHAALPDAIGPGDLHRLGRLGPGFADRWKTAGHKSARCRSCAGIPAAGAAAPVNQRRSAWPASPPSSPTAPRYFPASATCGFRLKAYSVSAGMPSPSVSSVM